MNDAPYMAFLPITLVRIRGRQSGCQNKWDRDGFIQSVAEIVIPHMKLLESDWPTPVVNLLRRAGFSCHFGRSNPKLQLSTICVLPPRKSSGSTDSNEPLTDNDICGGDHSGLSSRTTYPGSLPG